MAGNRKSGRKPKSINMLKLSGNFRPDRHKVIEVDLPVGMPNPPRCVVNDPIAMAEWNRISRRLDGLMYITELDLGVLAGYCLEFSKFIKANEKLTEIDSMLTKSTKRTIMINPLVKISDRSLNNMIRIASELGFTPSARHSLRIEPKVEISSEKAKFFMRNTGND